MPKFSVTDYQHEAHTALVDGSRKERQAKAGLRGAFGNHIKQWPTLAKNLSPWKRDGFTSELHYFVHHKKAALYQAFGDDSHPLHAKAIEAHGAGLLPGIKL